ncbi:MAG: hypothetical protein CVU42_10870 [Chloroflexi bacterium HGW-Chloroflexi-4]|jgi:hypothetical protein|nr:MAG: hypothetical protein CVU45_05210 [Chloroflexi bacterium HGW-Chloroflexi-7]PKN98710.1 MAG: hypothetical protein CVU42_10870 [Chloroflexi bacterium HGW-Chloroflexi-4]
MTRKLFIPDLTLLASNDKNIIPAELDVKWGEDIKGKSALHVQPTKDEFDVEDEWIIPLVGIDFENGEIEFDALGKNHPPQSNFLGIAFHILDAKTHDVVYFRPFNFMTDDAERKIHAVQYISHPKYRWFNLRQDFPSMYEKPIFPTPDGDEWFHAKIVVQQSIVSVFVNHNPEPSLVITELGDGLGKGLGLWCGPGQGGYFANLKITVF